MSPIRRVGQRLSQCTNTYMKEDDLPPLLAPSRSTLTMDNEGTSGHFEAINLEPFSSPMPEGKRERTTRKQHQLSPRDVGDRGEGHSIHPAFRVQRPEPVHYGRTRPGMNSKAYRRDVISIAEALRDDPRNAIAPKPPTWAEKFRKAWRYFRGEAKMEHDLEANRYPASMSTITTIDTRDPQSGKFQRLRRKCRAVFRNLFSTEGAIQTERPQVGSREVTTIIPVHGRGRTPVTPRRAHPTKPRVAVKKDDKVDGVRNLERRAEFTSEKKRGEVMKAQEQRNVSKAEPRRSMSAAKPSHHGHTEVSMGSIELVDLEPLPEEDTEATYQKWLASKESTAIVFESGGDKSGLPIVHVTQWPPQPTRVAPSLPIYSAEREEHSEDDVGSTADVSDDEFLDDGSQLHNGRKVESANTDSSGQLQRDAFSQVYQDSQIRSSLETSKAFEASEEKFSTPKRSKTDPSSEKHSAMTPRYLDFFAKLLPSKTKQPQPVRPRSMSAPTPGTGTPFEDPSPGRKNNWKGTEAFLIGMSPSPSPTMTEEEFRAQYFLRDPDKDDGYMKMDSKTNSSPESHQYAIGLNIQDVDMSLDAEGIKDLHEMLQVVAKEANEDKPRPLRRKKAFDRSQVKRYSSLDSSSEKCGFGTGGENDLPEYIRRVRSKTTDEPTTEAEAAKRRLLKQDPQLYEDFAHYTKLQQNKRSPPPDITPAFKSPRYRSGHLHRSPATPGGLLMTKSAPAQGEKSPFPLLEASCKITKSGPTEHQRSKTTKTRRRANANPSLTRFPVRPSPSASPASVIGRQMPPATPDPTHQPFSTASTLTPSGITIRRSKFDKPFEFPAKSPKILEDLPECPSVSELNSYDQVQLPQSNGGVVGGPLVSNSQQPAFIQPIISQPVRHPTTQRSRGDSNELRPLILLPPLPLQESKAFTQLDSTLEQLPPVLDLNVPRKLVQRSDSEGLRPFQEHTSISPQGSGAALSAFDAGTPAKLPVDAPQGQMADPTIQPSRVGSLSLRPLRMPPPPPVIPRSSRNHFPPKIKVEDNVVDGAVDGAGDNDMNRRGDEWVEERVALAEKARVQDELRPETAMAERQKMPRHAQRLATASATGSPRADASRALFIANHPALRGRQNPAAHVSLLNPDHPQPRPFQAPRLQFDQHPNVPRFIITTPPPGEPTFTARLAALANEMNDRLQVQTDPNPIKSKAVEDARQMQAAVIDMCNRTGKSPPPYVLTELTGKGTFGRVYKSKHLSSAEIVAVKIIDIDESDTMNPRLADSYSEFMKEVQALQKLSETKARNINHIIEALPVGSAMWMITEYCGGGSISTLMKPTAPGGLQEKWIIPILREVAEAIMWVHQADIIHRDIKCANVLVTEEGGVQLCDFGVSGIIEDRLDKRSTVIGTPHWMAPEMFSSTPNYGKEIDIWAFGSMVYEIATGLPPNAGYATTFGDFQVRHRIALPRLEGGNYSKDLRDLVAFCLEELPSARPSIEQVQRHSYIFNTSARYPTSSLSNLVRAFKVWEQHGGSRKSLFMAGGAQAPSDSASGSVNDDEWNFSTTQAFDDEFANNATAQDVVDAYGSGIMLAEEPPRAKGGRRRPPPQALAAPLNPLLRVFDPNTKSNYHDNSRAHYGLQMPPPTSDLPLRDDSARTAIKDTMIDLDGHDSDPGLSSFREDTIKPVGRRMEDEDDFATLHDFSRPALSDPADANPNRRTQDWTFPSASKMAPPASADPELSRFPSTYGVPRPAITPGSGGRPALMHHPTEPLGVSFGGGMSAASQLAPERRSMAESLIDLDMSMPDTYPELTRPSTANSDVGSTTSEQMTSGNPFEFERHVSYQAPVQPREPSIYIDDTALTARPESQNRNRDIADISDFSVSDVEPDHRDDPNDLSRFDVSGFSDGEYVSMAPNSQSNDVATSVEGQHEKPYTVAHFPDLPEPPSAAALLGTASPARMATEFQRTLDSLIGQLGAFADVYVSEEVVPKRNSKRK